MDKNDVAQILAAASDSLRQQFKSSFIKTIDLSSHNTYLEEAKQELLDFFIANLSDRPEQVLREFNNWVHNTMKIVYRKPALHTAPHIRQLYRKAYFSSPMGDVFQCCAELMRIVFGAYDIIVDKTDMNGTVEIYIDCEIARNVFIFA